MENLSIEQAIDLGIQLHQSGRLAEAEKIYQQVLSRQPDHPDVLHLLGVVATQSGRSEEAVGLIERAISIVPSPVYYNNLGKALFDHGEFEKAAVAYQRAISLKPDYFEAHNNLGVTLKEMGQGDEAMEASRAALKIKPDYPEAHWSLALGLLQKGDFAAGWREYEWRLACADLPRPADFPQPRWDGKPLNGRTILLHSEQGYGDMIQFARYAELVARRERGGNGRVILSCPPEMARLLKNCTGVAEIAASNGPLPAFDVHCPLGSLPLMFATRLDSAPANIPYLRADEELVRAWGSRIGTHVSARQIRVGVAWSGNPRQSNDRRRSMRLDQLAPLAKNPRVRFFSLQKGPAAEQAGKPPQGMRLIDLAPYLQDFADTAAAMANLDLVITVDTAAAHLAGALDRPVWVMLSHPFDWRYLLDRADSPWYPTMRLFRQEIKGDWDGVIARVAEALTRM